MGINLCNFEIEPLCDDLAYMAASRCFSPSHCAVTGSYLLFVNAKILTTQLNPLKLLIPIVKVVFKLFPDVSAIDM